VRSGLYLRYSPLGLPAAQASVAVLPQAGSADFDVRDWLTYAPTTLVEGICPSTLPRRAMWTGRFSVVQMYRARALRRRIVRSTVHGWTNGLGGFARASVALANTRAAKAYSWLRFTEVAGAASTDGGEGGTHQSLPAGGIRLAMQRVRRQR
jgi:hypothetical protein